MKKAISILISCIMMTSAMPFTAIAAEDQPSVVSETDSALSGSYSENITWTVKENNLYFNKTDELVWIFTNNVFSDSFTEDQYVFIPEENGKYLVVLGQLNDDKIMTSYIVNSVDGKITVEKSCEYELKRDDDHPEQMLLQQSPIFSAANDLIDGDHFFRYINARGYENDTIGTSFILNSQYSDSTISAIPSNDFRFYKLETYKTIDGNKEKVYTNIVSGCMPESETYPDGNVDFTVTENGKSRVYSFDFINNDIVPSSMKEKEAISNITTEDSEAADLQSAQMIFDYIHDNYLNATVFFTMDFALSGEEYSKYEDIFHKWQEETKGLFTPQGARKTKAEFKREAESFAEYVPLDKYKIQVVCKRNEVAEILREFIKSSGLDEDRFYVGDLDISAPTYITVDFDANCDDRIDISDAVLIMQSIANPDKYGLNGTDKSHITEQGQKNADTNGDGVTNLDALAIQKKLLKLD